MGNNVIPVLLNEIYEMNSDIMEELEKVKSKFNPEQVDDEQAVFLMQMLVDELKLKLNEKDKEISLLKKEVFRLHDKVKELQKGNES